MQRLVAGNFACKPVASFQQRYQGNASDVRLNRTVVWCLSEDEKVLEIESQVRKGARAKRAAKKAKRAAEDREGRSFQVDAPIRDAVQSGKLTQAQVTEGQYISVLFVIFAAILVEGVFVASSGFLPEAFDNFAQNYVYQAFSPTVFLFLACSTAYGIWKTKEDPDSVNDSF